MMTANLPDGPKLKVGNSVTLVDSANPKRKWEITYVSDHVNEKSALNKGWHNNI